MFEVKDEEDKDFAFSDFYCYGLFESLEEYEKEEDDGEFFKLCSFKLESSSSTS